MSTTLPSLSMCNSDPGVFSLGAVDPGTVQKVEVEVTDAEKQRLERVANRPSLSEILNLHDFEVCVFAHICDFHLCSSCADGNCLHL